MISGDASDFHRLADELADVGPRSVPALRSGMAAAGKYVERAWQNNARATSGAHGKHYPDSITSEILLGFGSVTVEVGPDSSRLQGRMGRGFEFGSRNQPPHLDGAKALESSGAMIERSVANALDPLFP